MRFSYQALINFIVFIIIIIGLIVFAFWRFGILKKEAPPSEILTDIKNKIDFVNSYSYQDFNNYLKNLSVQKPEIYEIRPEELGRPSLF
jgi:hypothetical protein